MAAKQATTIDHISRGRFSLNIVAGWYASEIEMFGAPQRSHDDRYASAIEWLEIVKRLWTEDGEVDFDGRFYQIKGAVLAPKPLQQPHPVVMNAGGSDKGREFAAKYSDVAFVPLQGKDFDSVKATVDRYRSLARKEYGRELLVWSGAYVVQGDTEEEAKAYFDDYVIQKGDRVAVDRCIEFLGLHTEMMPPDVLQQFKMHFTAGWGGFPLIGTREQVVDGLAMLAKAGLDGILLSWPRYIADMRHFQKYTYPLLEQAGLR
jgi:alkanesulfonate monooxygenase SsuD/methylene tetrahydromethanopterin reductase-like flavin-dependent oxidoreductase (luciferase family)